MIGRWDLALIVAVTAQTLALAYTYQPMVKAVWFSLPIPFTLVTLAVGEPVGLSHLAGFVPLTLFILTVMLLYRRVMPIVPAILVAVVVFIGVSLGLKAVLAETPLRFWLGAGGLFVVGAVLVVVMPEPVSDGYRTPLPVWQKLPIILLVVVGLIVIKRYIGGYAAFFPMVTTVAAYESRHCLYALLKQLPILSLALVPLIMIARYLQPAVGLPSALAVGWIAFVAIYLPMTIHRWKADTKAKQLAATT